MIRARPSESALTAALGSPDKLRMSATAWLSGSFPLEVVCALAPRRNLTHELTQSIELFCRFGCKWGPDRRRLGPYQCRSSNRWIKGKRQNPTGSNFDADSHACDLCAARTVGVCRSTCRAATCRRSIGSRIQSSIGDKSEKRSCLALTH